MRKPTPQSDKIIELTKQGLGIASIVVRTGYPKVQVKNCVVYWRRTLRAKGLELPNCRCGQPSNHMHNCSEKPRGPVPARSAPPDFKDSAAKYSLENLKRLYRANSITVRRWLAETGLTVADRGFAVLMQPPIGRIEELATEGCSFRTIAIKTGKSIRSIRHFVRRWRERLRNEGSPIPRCKCGGQHDHSYFCWEKIRGEGIGRRVRRQPPEDFEDTAPTLSKKALAHHYRTGHLVISRWLGEFPNLVRPPRSRPSKPLRPVYRAKSGISDATYNLIERCVPTSYAPDIREDITSTIYLAVLDGSIPEEQLLRDGRAILYSVLRSHGIMYQRTVSIDEELSDEGERYIDFIADDDALAAFDRIFDEEEF